MCHLTSSICKLSETLLRFWSSNDLVKGIIFDNIGLGNLHFPAIVVYKAFESSHLILTTHFY